MHGTVIQNTGRDGKLYKQEITGKISIIKREKTEKGGKRQKKTGNKGKRARNAM